MFQYAEQGQDVAGLRAPLVIHPSMESIVMMPRHRILGEGIKEYSGLLKEFIAFEHSWQWSLVPG